MGEEKIAMVSMLVKPGDIAYMVTSNRRKGDFTHAVIITDVENKKFFMQDIQKVEEDIALVDILKVRQMGM